MSDENKRTPYLRNGIPGALTGIGSTAIGTGYLQYADRPVVFWSLIGAGLLLLAIALFLIFRLRG